MTPATDPLPDAPADLPRNVPLASPPSVAELPSAPLLTPAHTRYVVRQGDDITRIAASFGVPVDAIIAVNTLSDPDRIAVGEVLRIPR